jgi:hypothetical protein
MGDVTAIVALLSTKFQVDAAGSKQWIEVAFFRLGNRELSNTR